MAGPFTHWMVVEEALKKPSISAQANLTGNKNYILLGAVSPDLPYLSTPNTQWADRMHYENTGSFVRHGIANLPPKGTPKHDICLAWLLGYVSHLVADVVVHPVVNVIVGPYRFNDIEHRRCELTQDALVYSKVMTVEGAPTQADLTDTDYHHFLNHCASLPVTPANTLGSPDINKTINEFWSVTLSENHMDQTTNYEPIDPNAWYRNYKSGINTASRMPSAAIRELLSGKGLAYQKLNSPKLATDRLGFFDNINIPKGGRGNFLEVFYKAVGEVVRVWDLLLEDINKGDPNNCAKYVKNWDLDTGLDMDNYALWS